jgi:hypothetical protein
MEVDIAVLGGGLERAGVGLTEAQAREQRTLRQ